MLPALPVRAASRVAGGSASKALWAGIYAKAGSGPKFVGVARGMGLSNAAIRGVGARSIGVHVAVSAVSNGAGSRAVLPARASGQSRLPELARTILRDTRRAVPDDDTAQDAVPAEMRDAPHQP